MPTSQSTAVQHVRDTHGVKPGRVAAVYCVGTRHVWVSTVLDPRWEETMAFDCDERGDVLCWTEIACSTGAGSRQRVLEQLAEMAAQTGIGPSEEANH